MAKRDKRAEQQRINLLTELKSPLVFFGFALSIMEGTLGAALLLRNLPAHAMLLLAFMMTIILLAAIGVVAFLAYKVPEVVRVQEPQREIHMAQIAAIVTQLTQSVEALSALAPLGAKPPGSQEQAVGQDPGPPGTAC